jgi:hypothetical protein
MVSMVNATVDESLRGKIKSINLDNLEP